LSDLVSFTNLHMGPDRGSNPICATLLRGFGRAIFPFGLYGSHLVKLMERISIWGLT